MEYLFVLGIVVLVMLPMLRKVQSSILRRYAQMGASLDPQVDGYYSFPWLTRK